MNSIKRILCACVVAGAALLPVDAAAQFEIPPGCVKGPLPHGAESLICFPPANLWNGELVVYAHGYVPPGLPLGFYNLKLADGTFLPDLVRGLGYAFATTTYRRNGLNVLEGVDDVRNLVAAFGSPVRTHVAGVSEGGLVATL